MRIDGKWALTTSLGLCIVACGAVPEPEEGLEYGSARIAIAEAPADVQCISVTAAGVRTRTEDFDVAPGESTVLSMNRLATGDVTFTADAFDGPCGSDAPRWIAEPTTVQIATNAVADVALVMRRNGRADVTVDFQDDCDPTTGSCGCVPAPELCDGLDNDCDGIIDNNVPEEGSLCGLSTGECLPGAVRCIAGTLVCVGAVSPSPEVCDGLDNDCDGIVDNGTQEAGLPCGSGSCAGGVTECVGGTVVCQGTNPTPEICDGLDNDCNGVIDDNVQGEGILCGTNTGECSAGVERCINGNFQCIGATLPEPEICDTLDNDCDGLVDEDGACP